MMKILIIEDEPLAAKQLKDTIVDCCSGAICFPVIDSVQDAVAFLRAAPQIDLIFMDIHLADGLAFEIFDAVETDLHIVFTTAYDQYAIRAFDVNSIDYLLKPITREKVQKAILKFQRQGATRGSGITGPDIRQLQKLLAETSVYRENFLISFKEKLLPVPVKDFAWFEIKNGVVIGTRFDKTSMVLEERSLDELAVYINPKQFYRANRQYLINRHAVKEIAHYFNGKLQATMQPAPSQAIVISREKIAAFKSWMSG